MTSTSKPSRRSTESADASVLQSLWLAASDDKDGNPIEIPCASPDAAKSLRMKLYNAVRNAKNFPLEYPLLATARQACEAIIPKDQQAMVIVRRKQISSDLSNVLQVLKARGVEPDAEGGGFKSAEDREMEESLNRLTNRVDDSTKPTGEPATPANPLAGLATERPENPFFSRG